MVLRLVVGVVIPLARRVSLGTLASLLVVVVEVAFGRFLARHADDGTTHGYGVETARRVIPSFLSDIEPPKSQEGERFTANRNDPPTVR